MLKLDKVFGVLDKNAPIELSNKCIANGEYDNSGILVKSHDGVNKILFSLDLSVEAVKKAKRLGCDTIVTHHPAIYTPLKNLNIDDSLSASVLLAIENKMNVISMHLNLDNADDGIDAMLCKGLGGEKYKILEYLDQSHGYGREFKIDNLTLVKFVQNARKTFKSQRVLYYGNKKAVLRSGASFCGSGYDYAMKALKDGRLKADVIISSDMPHHVIKEFIENGKAIVLLTHYSAENYGFTEYYNRVKEQLKGVSCFNFTDKRFM